MVAAQNNVEVRGECFHACVWRWMSVTPRSPVQTAAFGTAVVCL